MIDVTALDVGARLVCLDAAGRIVRIEEAGRRFAADLGVTLELGAQLSAETARALAARMADRLFEAMNGGSPTAGGAGLLRLDPLAAGAEIAQVSFSGGVSEYIYGREAQTYGDLGVLLGTGNSHPRRGLGAAARTGERRHPRHRHRRVAIHHAGERQHHLRLAAWKVCRCAMCR